VSRRPDPAIRVFRSLADMDASHAARAAERLANTRADASARAAGAALHFPGGALAASAPTRAQLERSAGEWFEQAIEAFGKAAEKSAEGDPLAAIAEMENAERCSATTRRYMTEAAALPQVQS